MTFKVKTKGQIEGEKLLVPKLRFKEFKDKYMITNINNIAVVTMGQSPNSVNYTSDRNDIILIQGNADLNNGKIQPRLYTTEITKMCEINDIIMTVRAPVGDLAITEYKACIGRGVCSIKGSKYLYYYLENLKYKGEWKKLSKGSTIDSITSNDLKNINVTIPDETEQEKIANFLSLLDKKIDLQKKKIEALKIYKRGLIQRIYNRTWNNKIKMEEILIQKSIRNTNDEIHNVYSVSNKDGFILQTEQFKDRIVASEDTRNYKVVAKNDFAYNPARINVGSIARMKQDIKGIISPMYICFKCNEKILPEYLEYFFESSKFTYEMSKRLEGSVRMCLSYESMLNIPIELPNKNEQEKISTFLNSLSNKIKLEEKKFIELNKLKKGLLQKMFI